MEKLLSPQELAEKTGLKVSYLYHLTYHKRIPFLKLGCLVKFRPSDIEKWIAACEVSHAVSASAKVRPKLKQSPSPSKAKRKRKLNRHSTVDSFVKQARGF